MKSITAFQTSDGQIFPSEALAEKHEILLSKESVVDEFLSSAFNPYKSHAHGGMARNTIINWEHWKSKNEIISK